MGKCWENSGAGFLGIYPPVMTVTVCKLEAMAQSKYLSLPMQDGDFPLSCKRLPEGSGNDGWHHWNIMGNSSKEDENRMEKRSDLAHGGCIHGIIH